MISVFKELDKEKTIISIPALLAENVRNKIEKTDFVSVSDFTTYLLRQMLAETVKKEKITEKDEQKIKNRLKALGYFE
ncbi:CopG family transcriptional regulator [Candidatus Woesearchaeota archaeon]|nr:CopG family transcriptional regulator [Candidatus Woesearchaeota archaeon]